MSLEDLIKNSYQILDNYFLLTLCSILSQETFFVNNDFNAQDFNQKPDIDVDAVRRGCPVITSGADEDSLSMAVAVKILTDPKVYGRLVAEE